MTKSELKVSNKLPFWAAIPAVIIIAGLVLFFVLGFNPAASMSNTKSLLITHDPFVSASEELGEDLQKICTDEIKKAGLSVIDCKVTTTSTGGELEYIFTAETSAETLATVWTNISTALQADEELQYGVYSADIHDNTIQYGYGYIWRAAISAGVALALAFIYVSIRYRFSMGLSTLLVGIVDLAVMLSLTVILRIPVTTALATAAIFAVLYSVLVSTVACNKIRALLKSEEYSSLPVAEGVDKANGQSMKNVILLGAVTVVFFALLAIFGGSAVCAFALPAICGVVASTYSGALLLPSLTAAFKTLGVKMQASRAEKARLARQKEEEAKAQKRAAKKN